MAVRVRVWDLPLRLVHWSLVALIGLSWWSGKAHAMDWHRRSGYAILALLVFRGFWGIAGPRTARFADFVRGPRAVLAYARGLRRTPAADPPPAPGHNPAGGWSVIALLLVLAAMVAAGLFAVDVDGIESGPLADWISFDGGRRAAHLHALVFDGLLGLIGLHLVAIVLHRVWLRHDLIGPMITGRAPAAAADAGVSPVPRWRVLAGVALAGAAAWAASRGFWLVPPG